MAFPTTILVDRNGNIVGDPMLGGIDNQDNYDTLMKQIQSVIDADSTKNKNMQKAPVYSTESSLLQWNDFV